MHRIKEFNTLLKRYNDVKSRHGYYNFEDGINVISAGDRDPDLDDVSGMSASKMRAAAAGRMPSPTLWPTNAPAASRLSPIAENSARRKSPPGASWR